MRILSFLTPLLALLLAAQAPGCIRQYNDFVGAQDVTSDYTDTVDVDVPEPKDTTDTVHTDTVDVDVCVPNCDGKVCGEDGCGGTCGICADNENCQSGQCVTDDETWIDSSSGLTWQVEPTGGSMNWSKAQSHCQGLSLDGGGWYLPTIGELRTLIRGCPGTITGGACGVTDECLDFSCSYEGGCLDCSGGGGPADGCYWPNNMKGSCCWYWSSSPVEDIDDYAWFVFFNYGFVNYYDVSNDIHVRCVR